MFKKGDRVKKKDGIVFSDGSSILTIRGDKEWSRFYNSNVWYMKETGTFMSEKYIELAEEDMSELKHGDRVVVKALENYECTYVGVSPIDNTRHIFVYKNAYGGHSTCSATLDNITKYVPKVRAMTLGYAVHYKALDNAEVGDIVKCGEGIFHTITSINEMYEKEVTVLRGPYKLYKQQK